MTDITVIVINFNQGDMIREAVESARAQTVRPTRIVVVDDGSDDPSSLAVLEELGKAPDVMVARQENAGPSAARNHGIRLASTPYVAVMDGDDRLLPDFLERTSAMLDADGDVVAASGWLRTFGVLDAIVRPTGGGTSAFVSHNCCPATVTIRREAWRRCGGYDESMRNGFEDWDFYLSLLESHGPDTRIAVIGKPLIEYRTASASSNVTSMNHRLSLMKYLIGKHSSLYADHVADAVLGTEAISIRRLAMWEESAAELGLTGTGREFMAHPSYGDGGMG